MPGVEITKHIAAPPEKVFAAAADFHNADKRIEAIRKLEVLTDGPVGVGTRFRETRIMFKREATEEMEVTAFDPPRSYTVEAESHGCHYVSVFEFKPNGSGTDVHMRFEAEPLTFFAKAMSAMLSGMMKKVATECAKDLDDLKAAIESS